MGHIWAVYGPYMGHTAGEKRDLYPRPVWCGRVGGCGGNTRDFGEHATKGGNKRDFGKHATKVGTLKEFRKKDANFAIFCATEGGNKRDFCEHARKGGQKRDFGEHGISVSPEPFCLHVFCYCSWAKQTVLARYIFA